MTEAIDNPILNSPYELPDRYYEISPNGPTGRIREGRRPSESFIPIAITRKGRGEQTGFEQVELDFDATGERRESNTLINDIRRDVEASDEGFANVAATRKLGRIPVLMVRMNADLLMGEELKKAGAGNLFTIFGEPDIEIDAMDDGLIVHLKGVDVYDPTTGDVRSRDTSRIALWMIDTDYNEESFFVRHCYFTGGNDPYKRLKTALKADIDAEAWESIYATSSRPFAKPETGKIAVKVINDYGDEVMKVFDV